MTSERLQRIRSSPSGSLPGHVAVIMDGNGRWARERDLPRREGHEAGMKAVRETVEGAIEVGIDVLSLFAFSQENWQRPASEIAFLMKLLQRYARTERDELVKNGVEVHVVGDLGRLEVPARRAIDLITSATRGGDRLQLILAISYGGRGELVEVTRRLAERVAEGKLRPSQIDEDLFASELLTARWGDPDLLIRTSGEYRISNFMLWQVAYSELYTTEVLWPDFTREDLYEAVLDYQKRERRFGKVEA
jgi:undecaprenyl diphosphate synthase